MSLPAQVGGAPLGTLLLAALVVVILAAVVRYGRGGRDRAQARNPEGEVVCPRCHHTTDPGSDRCPECGKEL